MKLLSDSRLDKSKRKEILFIECIEQNLTSVGHSTFGPGLIITSFTRRPGHFLKLINESSLLNIV